MNADSQPIFILGIMPRSGTNFLSNLLLLHPDCGSADPVWEDFLVTHLDLLGDYSDRVAGRWDDSWGVDNETREHLDVSLGLGPSAFLKERCRQKRVVSKTPFVDNLELFFRFFPSAKLLVLVRDGRSVVESSVRSFGWRREAALHAIARAARTIRQFRQGAQGEADQFRLLRYEDLWNDTETQMRELCAFLDLDWGRYDLEQALNLPVRGSSELKNADGGEIHWDPVDRGVDFDPLSRFADWSRARHFRYNRVAGAEMEALGYSPTDVRDSLGLYRLQSFFLDIAWALKAMARPVYHRLVKS